MTWDDLIANRWVQKHRTSPNEIRDLRNLIERDLTDARIEALSEDRRFATAYNGALQISKMAIAAAGYRLAKGNSAHFQAFETLKTAIPTTEIEDLCDYFDRCRRKRNHIDYDSSDVVTQTEVEEIIEKTIEFRNLVEEWIAAEHRELRA